MTSISSSSSNSSGGSSGDNDLKEKPIKNMELSWRKKGKDRVGGSRSWQFMSSCWQFISDVEEEIGTLCKVFFFQEYGCFHKACIVD